MITNNDAYRAAIAEIERTTAILKKTGGILRFGMLPEGFIETNEGMGKATFKINIEGKESNMSVKIHLSKRQGTDWTVHKLKYK